LCQDKEDPYVLKLVADGNREECYFNIKPKNNDNEGKIKYESLVRIQAAKENYFLQ